MRKAEAAFGPKQARQRRRVRNGLAAVHGGRYIYPHQTKSVLGDAPVPCRRPVVLRQ